MISFLIKRPIAISMTLLSLLTIGALALGHLPTSLMPDIEIPEITIKLGEENIPARELDLSIVEPLRHQLKQVSNLKDLYSIVNDEQATITLAFNHGTNINLAAIEVNEKVDQALTSFPFKIDRPKVIKS